MFLTSVKIHSCCGSKLVPFPFRWHSSIFTWFGLGVAWRHSCFPMLWRTSFWDEYSKYWKVQSSNQRPDCPLNDQKFFFSCVCHCTWFPPMLWHIYMITGLPPWLFSPTSRQVPDPEFLIWCKHIQQIILTSKVRNCATYRRVENMTYCSKLFWG